MAESAKPNVNLKTVPAWQLLQVMEMIPCFMAKRFMDTGGTACMTARTQAGAQPNDVGQEGDSLIKPGELLAKVCLTCPVILTAFANLPAEPTV